MSYVNTALKRARKTLIGSRAFYAMVLAIVVPIIVQNTITNFVNLLDNIMVGKLGTDQMAGVSIANQLMFVSNLCVFGGVSGAGIFAAQYHGAGNNEGVRSCFRFKLMLCACLAVIAIVIFCFMGGPLISLYLNDGDAPERIAATLGHGLSYMHIMLWGIAPFALTQAYAGTLRETGETGLPMRASITAVLTNLVLNYTLIYGHFGMPAMGVRGAALATVISRYVELGIIVISTHTRPERYRFIHGAYRSMRIPLPLVRQIIIKGMPLLVNEALWSLGVAMLTRCYSLRGLDVVAALNISSTVSNLFNVVFLSMGNATAIIIGQALGARKTKEAREQVWQLIFFSLLCCMVTGVLLSIASPFIPLIYNTTDSIRHLATRMLLVCACCMPLISIVNSCYFILRSGGKTGITFAFDCGFSWIVSIPLALVLVKGTSLSIVAVYFLVQLADLIKCIVGYILVRKGVWINNIVID